MSNAVRQEQGGPGEQAAKPNFRRISESLLSVTRSLYVFKNRPIDVQNPQANFGALSEGAFIRDKSRDLGIPQNFQDAFALVWIQRVQCYKLNPRKQPEALAQKKADEQTLWTNLITSQASDEGKEAMRKLVYFASYAATHALEAIGARDDFRAYAVDRRLATSLGEFTGPFHAYLATRTPELVEALKASSSSNK